MKIELIKASGDSQEVDLPKEVKTIADLRDEFDLNENTRVIEGGKELKNNNKISKGMQVVIIPKEEQGAK